MASGKEKEQLGQTTLEYILVILIVIGLAMVFYPRVQAWVTAPCSQLPSSLSCKIEKFYQRDNFRYWRIPGI